MAADEVFVAVGKEVAAVLDAASSVLAAEGYRVDGSGASWLRLTPPGGHPGVEVALQQDTVGVLVVARGIPDPGTAIRLRNQLDGVQAGPPLGARVSGPPPLPARPAAPAPVPQPEVHPVASPAPVSVPPTEPPTVVVPSDSTEDDAGTTVPVARRRLLLRFTDGSELEVDRPLLVGRDPSRTRPGQEEAVPVVVRDPQVATSKTHLSLRPRRGLVEVEDLGSTNGTEIARPGGGFARCTPYAPALLEPGGRLRFGSFEATLELG